MDESKELDPRWGDYVPWFLRYKNFSDKGNFEQLFTRVSQRLDRLFKFNEANLPNLLYVCSVLESESLQKFTDKQRGTAADQIRDYFDPRVIMDESKTRLYGDPEARTVASLEGRLSLRRLPGGGRDPRTTEGQSTSEIEAELAIAQLTEQVARPGRLETHLKNLYFERLEVLECLLLVIPPDSMASTALVRDIRRFFVEAGLKLDIRGTPPAIVPIEEPALQRGVLRRLPILGAQLLR